MFHVRKDRKRENKIKLDAAVRHRQMANPVRVVLRAVTIEMHEVSARIRAASLFHDRRIDVDADAGAMTIHADLFPDNVFFRDHELSGLIDFYFACNDAFAYDVAICLNAWCFEPDKSFNATKGRALLQGYVKALGVRAFNVAFYMPPLGPTQEDWSDFPTVVYIVDRGDPSNRTSDMGAMELYAASVVASDPFRVAEALRDNLSG